MAEWSNAFDLKSNVVKATEGSNPSLSVAIPICESVTSFCKLKAKPSKVFFNKNGYAIFIFGVTERRATHWVALLSVLIFLDFKHHFIFGDRK